MSPIARHLDVCLSRALSLVPATVMVVALTAATGCGTRGTEAAAGASERASQSLALDLDTTKTSASGLSSGAFMAVQFHVAYSSTMRGVAAFAGGPFRCAQGSISGALTTCMSSSSTLDPAPLVAITKAYAAAGAVDGVEHLKGQRVFLFGGAKDTTVNPAVMDGLRDYYAAFVDAADLSFERRRPGTAHTMPTESHGGACATTASPYLGSCGYDGAGAALAHIHGPLAPRAAAPGGDLVALAQGDFVVDPAAHSLADTAYAYVPRSCGQGERCTVHVAFHGCQQSTSAIGDAFIKHAGYNEWADTNHIVVLYPQTIAKQGANPNGCWDWWGYDSPDYAKKTGPQLKMVKAMVDALAAGSVAVGDAGAPGASDGGAEASDAAGVETAAPQAEAACVTASNAAHVANGRAHAWFGLAFAAGSNQALGLANDSVRTSLRRVAPGVFTLGRCP